MSAPKTLERHSVVKTNHGDDVMSEFLYLYRGGEPTGTPTEMQQQMQRWVS